MVLITLFNSYQRKPVIVLMFQTHIALHLWFHLVSFFSCNFSALEIFSASLSVYLYNMRTLQEYTT